MRRHQAVSAAVGANRPVRYLPENATRKELPRESAHRRILQDRDVRLTRTTGRKTWLGPALSRRRQPRCTNHVHDPPSPCLVRIVILGLPDHESRPLSGRLAIDLRVRQGFRQAIFDQQDLRVTVLDDLIACFCLSGKRPKPPEVSASRRNPMSGSLTFADSSAPTFPWRAW